MACLLFICHAPVISVSLCFGWMARPLRCWCFMHVEWHRNFLKMMYFYLSDQTMDSKADMICVCVLLMGYLVYGWRRRDGTLFWDWCARGNTLNKLERLRVCWGFQSLGSHCVRGMVDESHTVNLCGIASSCLVCPNGTDVWLGNAQIWLSKEQGPIDCYRLSDDIMVYSAHAGLEPKMAFTIMERVWVV